MFCIRFNAYALCKVCDDLTSYDCNQLVALVKTHFVNFRVKLQMHIATVALSKCVIICVAHNPSILLNPAVHILAH